MVGDVIFGKSVTMTLEKIGKSEDVRLNVPDEPVI